MRAFVLLFLLSGAASAQPALVAEASVDQASYAYGEPITFRYTVRNEGTEPTVIWGSSSCTLGFEFDGVDLDRACTTDEHPTWLGPEASVTWEWLLDPAELGLPTDSGTQTITGHVYGSCGLTYNEASPCPGHLAVSTSFEAPAYLGGLLAISFYPADADSLDALRQSYNGTVLTSFDYPSGHRYEQWRLEAVALDETVAALDANGIVRYARALRGIPEPTRYRVGTADSPERGSLSAPERVEEFDRDGLGPVEAEGDRRRAGGRVGGWRRQ